MAERKIIEKEAASARGSTARFLHSASTAIRFLQAYPWSGNVRELRHTVERAVALAERMVLDEKDVARAVQPTGGIFSPRSKAHRQLMEVLAGCGWDPVRAAEVLEVHWTTVYRRMKRLGVVRPGAAEEEGGHVTALTD